MNNQGFMSQDELQQFFRDLNEPGSLRGRDIPENVVFDDRELDLARRRIERIENELVPALKDELREKEGALERFLKTQPPRNWEKLRQWWETEHGTNKMRAQMASLKLEQSKLTEVIERTQHVQAERRALEGKEKAKGFSEKARNIVEKAKSIPKEASAVVELAEALNGRSLEEVFGGILKAAIWYTDLPIEKRHLEEIYNLVLDDVPSLKADGHERLRAAVEQLIGRSLEIGRNPRWRRVAAEQKATDRDRAAQRLGLGSLFGRK